MPVEGCAIRIDTQIRPTQSIEEDRAWIADFLTSGAILSADLDDCWILWGDPERSSTPSLSRPSMYAPDFFLREPQPWRTYPFWARISASDMVAILSSVAPNSPAVAGAHWTQPSKSDFQCEFEELKRTFEQGRLTKAVPIIERTHSGAMEPTARATTLLRALELAAEFPIVVYGFWDDSEGMIGATPEILFEETLSPGTEDAQTQTVVRTMALAGTRPLLSDHEPLLDDPKERLEHRLVIEDIVSRLSEFGKVEVSETHELVLPTLLHLIAEIQVVPERYVRFEDWVIALHPTPAIGAWPRSEGWRWLESQAHANSRGRFGAPFGLVNPERTEARCVVAIRNIQWDRESARVFAGCGVIGPSVFEREWEELHAKLDAVQEALGV